MAKVAVSGGIRNVFCQISVFVLTGYLAYIGEVSIGSILATTALVEPSLMCLEISVKRSVRLKVQTPLFNKYELLESAANERKHQKRNRSLLLK